MTAPAIRTAELSRTFGAARAVDRLTLEVPRGIIFGFLGPNGSGKTTTIRLLLGLLDPSSGSAEVLGYDSRVHAPAIRERCGALLEHSGLYERLSAVENLDVYGRFWHLAPAARRTRTEELLMHFGLWERRHDIVAGWSRGMKQKLAIARAMLHRPQLLFLDEPTAGLDPLAAGALRDELSRLVASEGVTVFLTTHNLAEAERLCALVGLVRDGVLLACAPPTQLAAAHATPRVEITGTGLTDAMLKMVRAIPCVHAARVVGRSVIVELDRTSDTSTVVTALVSGGFQVEAVRSGATSLDEAFPVLVGARP